ncbi:uncharacterized protein LOC112575731 isoform X2 [Pomacea canaliculata]|uniref:uncharacterized protein LOC112575731 isoform X2 n=1 Tax=Pomacea canaliculata TaxID=400727 RepID=UPI000D72E955|nr:uncharacterized protein LOC112575731 isoform X2 [Pomacea canaliculata]
MYDSEILNSVQSEVTLRKMVQTHKGSLIHCNPTCLELDFISPAVDNSVKTAACFELSSPKLNDSFGNSLVDTEEIKCHDQILAGNISQNEEDRCEGTVISSICTEEYRTFGQVCETKGNNANGKETGPKNGDKSLVEKNQDGGVQGLANVTFVPKTVAYEKESFEARETIPSWKTLMDIDISPEDVFTCRSSQFEESRSVDKFTHPTAKDNERLGNQECGAEIMLRGPCKGTSSNLESFVTKGKISLQDVSHAAKNGDDNNSSISQKSKSSTRDVTIPLSALSLPSSSASLFTDSNNTFKSMLKETNTITQLESRKLCSNLHVESHTEHLSLRENSSKTTSSSDFSCYHETEADNPSHSFGNKCPPELSSALDDAAMVECFHHSNLSYCKQECKSSLEAPLPEVKDGKSTTMHTPVYQSFQTVSDVMDSVGCVLHSFPSREKDSQQSAMSSPRLGQAENLDESPLTNMQGGLVLEGQNINPSSGSINPFVGLDDVEEPEKQNIAEVVSAKLTGYKVQGMVSSDIVRRHMSPRPATSNMRRSLLSLPIYDRWTQRDAGTENVDPEKLRIWSTLEVECNENKEINNMVDLFSVKRNNDTSFHSWCHQRNNDGFRCIHEQKSEKILDYWNSKATDHSLCLMPPHEGTVCLSLAEPGDVKNRNVKSPVMFHLKPKSPSMSTPWTPEAKLQSFSDVNHMMDASQKHDPPLVSVGDQYSKFTKRGISIWSPQHASLSELSMQVCGRKHSAGTLSPKVPEFEVHDKDAETNIKCLDSTQTSLKPETSDVGGASHPRLSLYSGM